MFRTASAGRRALLSSSPRSPPLVSSRTLFSRSQPPPPPNPFRTPFYVSVLLVGGTLFGVYYLDSRSALHRYVITPVLRYALDAETAHKVAVKALKYGVGPRDPAVDGEDASLVVSLWDKSLSSPIGLAAGFDKDGEAIDGLLELGFSWVEIGSVTPKPQPGNPKPRVFHLADDSALINRYGFPSQGHAAMLTRLKARLPVDYANIYGTEAEESGNKSLREGALLAVNLGKNKASPVDSIDDYITGVKTFALYADVLVINVSSPNTPGLRGLQNKDSLLHLLTSVTKTRDSLPTTPTMKHKPKVVVKIAPDLSKDQIVDIAEVVRNSGVDGVIVSNTTVQRPDNLHDANATQQGGLSGPPLLPLSLTALRTLRSNLPSSIPLIGCGGISTGHDAIQFALAGASTVQILTEFGYGGPGVARRVKDEVKMELNSMKERGELKEGTWKELVKESVERLSLKEVKREEKKVEVPSLTQMKEKLEEKPPTVEQLVEEAKNIGVLLDKLGEKMGVPVSSST